jgi:hypothetical protein
MLLHVQNAFFVVCSALGWGLRCSHMPCSHVRRGVLVRVFFGALSKRQSVTGDWVRGTVASIIPPKTEQKIHSWRWGAVLRGKKKGENSELSHFLFSLVSGRRRAFPKMPFCLNSPRTRTDRPSTACPLISWLLLISCAGQTEQSERMTATTTSIPILPAPASQPHSLILPTSDSPVSTAVTSHRLVPVLLQSPLLDPQSR